MFYTRGMRVAYREEPCRSALNRVKGMPFEWSLNPYMGCVHRCTFCYVRAFERRADRPSDERYGTSIRVKVNVADVLRAEIARRVVDGCADRDRRRNRPVPAGRRPLPADATLHRGAARRSAGLLDHHPRPADRPGRRSARRGRATRRGLGHLLGADDRRRRSGARPSPGTAPPRQRLRALQHARRRTAIRACVGMAPLLPGLSDSRGLDRAGRRGGACSGRLRHLGEPPLPHARHARALPRLPRARLAGAPPDLRAALRATRVPPAGGLRSCTRAGRALARAQASDRRPASRCHCVRRRREKQLSLLSA